MAWPAGEEITAAENRHTANVLRIILLAIPKGRGHSNAATSHCIHEGNKTKQKVAKRKHVTQHMRRKNTPILPYYRIWCPNPRFRVWRLDFKRRMSRSP